MNDRIDQPGQPTASGHHITVTTVQLPAWTPRRADCGCGWQSKLTPSAPAAELAGKEHVEATGVSYSSAVVDKIAETMRALGPLTIDQVDEIASTLSTKASALVPKHGQAPLGPDDNRSIELDVDTELAELTRGFTPDQLAEVREAGTRAALDARDRILADRAFGSAPKVPPCAPWCIDSHAPEGLWDEVDMAGARWPDGVYKDCTATVGGVDSHDGTVLVEVIRTARTLYDAQAREWRPVNVGPGHVLVHADAERPRLDLEQLDGLRGLLDRAREMVTTQRDVDA